MNNSAILLLLLLVGSLSTVAQNRTSASSDRSNQLVHMVFFKPKSEAAKQRLIKSLETFRTIDVIRNVQIGLGEDTNNPKGFLSDYSVVLQLTFANLAKFRVYEKHPVHLASIEATKDLMASPPMGYDYYTNNE